MPTNDHIVPQMYLKRFASAAKGRASITTAAPVSNLTASFPASVKNVAAIRDFYWGTDPAGVSHHTMEALMTRIEDAAAAAFTAILDTDYALPRRWPPTENVRIRLSWWIAAQILRTKRQRNRIDYENKSAGLDPPANVGKFARNNPHLAFIRSHLAALALLLSAKPWGIGFSDACLPTGDVPVIILNGQDDEDQLLAAARWDVLLPLDPHRFILIPTRGSQDDPHTWFDHRLKLDGGLGAFVAAEIVSAAESHVFYHPDHRPPSWNQADIIDGPRLPRPWVGDDHPAPRMVIAYEALPPDANVERRWLTDHDWSDSSQAT